MCLVAVIVIFAVFFTGLVEESHSVEVYGNTCSLHRNDSCFLQRNGTYALCKVQNVSSLQAYLSDTTDIMEISLAVNKINEIEYGVFDGLRSLKTLNLSMNPLRSFTGNIHGMFPSLSYLDVTGAAWNPGGEFLRLPHLTRITGMTYSKYCTKCSMNRHGIATSQQSNLLYRLADECYRFTYNLELLPGIAGLLQGNMFSFTCENGLKCAKSEENSTLIDLENVCWPDSLVLLKAQVPIGIAIVIQNLIVAFNILSSKSLRCNPCMIFVCNMACSDFLFGVYTIIISSYFNVNTLLYAYIHSADNCWKIGFLWMLGQASSLFTSIFLTLERYLCIAFAFKVHMRISLRLACFLVVFIWSFAMFLTIFTVLQNFYSDSLLCIPVSTNDQTIIFTVTIFLFAIIFYLISFLLYIHIYFIAKRAAQDAGIKRETKTALRIAMVVSTNMFFLFFPVLLTGILSLISRKALSTVFLAFSMSISLNSLVNPFIHAFRNDRFVNELRKKVLLVRRRRTNQVMPSRPTVNFHETGL